MIRNEFGELIKTEWSKTALIRPNIVIDAFVVMPNHLHGILICYLAYKKSSVHLRALCSKEKYISPLRTSEIPLNDFFGFVAYFFSSSISSKSTYSPSFLSKIFFFFFEECEKTLLSSLGWLPFLLFLPKLNNERTKPNTKSRERTPMKIMRISMEKIRCIS